MVSKNCPCLQPNKLKLNNSFQDKFGVIKKKGFYNFYNILIFYLFTAKQVMSEDTVAGRVLIRKEILRLIVNISSSVGTKNSEQALLMSVKKSIF